MTLTIDLTSALEERLRQESARDGLSAEEYARKVLEERLLPVVAHRGAEVNGERLRSYQEWVGSHAAHAAPSVSDEAINRESIYRGREDRQL